ncbi:MAG TPA: hypothetical protein VE422_20130 [Terriglobia bacterium]|nr:hypothetical protein [Terriglobia bacterium]
MVTALLFASMMMLQGAPEAAIDFEQFHIEFTGSYWRLNPTGNVQTGTTQVDLRSDLGIRGRKGQGLFRVAAKPARKHRILFEAVPYRLEGHNTITRTFAFGGRTYTGQDTIDSDSRMNYLFGGYQYDFVTRPQGHVGVQVGVGYFDAKATVTSQRFGSSTEDGKAPFPLIGAEFRGFPIRGRNAFNLNGHIKGMSFGSHGHYIQSELNAGFGIGRHLTLQGGASVVDGDVHRTNRSKGFKLQFVGPTVSIQVRDR